MACTMHARGQTWTENRAPKNRRRWRVGCDRAAIPLAVGFRCPFPSPHFSKRKTCASVSKPLSRKIAFVRSQLQLTVTFTVFCSIDYSRIRRRTAEQVVRSKEHAAIAVENNTSHVRTAANDAISYSFSTDHIGDWSIF